MRGKQTMVTVYVASRSQWTQTLLSVSITQFKETLTKSA